MSRPEDPNELKAFEARLAALVPRDDRLDRERLAFLAGQASVANADNQRASSGGWRRHPAWPAAFAAMSAVAASLLLLLVMRPGGPGANSFAVDKKPQQQVEAPARAVLASRSVLTTQDVRYGDLEKRLAELEAERRVFDASLPAEDRVVPVYTPSAWQRVISDSGSSKPLPRKSSSVSHEQGINT